MSTVLRVLMWVAAGAFVLTLVQLGALLGFELGVEVVVHRMAVFVLAPIWLVVVLLTSYDLHHADVRYHDFWKFALRGCPTWMRRVLYGLVGYAILGFLVLILRATAGRAAESPVERGWAFGAALMIFYATAFAVLHSRIVAGPPRTRRCPNGHRVYALARYCEQCGQRLPVREAP